MPIKQFEETINEFNLFVKNEVGQSITELGKIKTETNRKHLQRLVYVNLVNRFDSLVDDLLLQFSIIDGELRNSILSKVKEEPAFLKDLFEILSSENPREVVQNRIENIARVEILRMRHSTKLRTLLKSCFEWQDTDLDRPRVNINNGEILKGVHQNQKKIPTCVIGYADWLYSRRNSFVHGNKPQLLKSDTLFISRRFHVSPASMISLKLSSINSASKFYLNICKKIITTSDKEI